MNAQVQAIVNSLTKNISIPVTQAQIPSIVVAAVTATLSMTTLSAADREQVVIGVIQYYISNSNMPVSEQTVIINLVPGMIDILENLPQEEAACSTWCNSISTWFKTNCKCCTESSCH